MHNFVEAQDAQLEAVRLGNSKLSEGLRSGLAALFVIEIEGVDKVPKK